MKDFARLADELGTLRDRLLAAEASQAARLALVHPAYHEGARNLVHYVALRQHDLRPLQVELWRAGLSSLGRLEGHVLDAIEQVRERLGDALVRRGGPGTPLASSRPRWEDADQLLHAHTHDLLGEKPERRLVHIMVTAPAAAEVTDAWADELMAAGTDVLRVNTAHEDEAAWAHIVGCMRAAAGRAQRPLRVLVDLPGPKLRTEALAEGPRVVHWKPARDDLGRVITPARIELHPRGRAAVDPRHALAVPDELWPAIATADALHLVDARGKRRRLAVSGERAEADRGVFLVPETEVEARLGDEVLARWTVGELPARPYRVKLHAGDRLYLLRAGATSPRPELPAFGCSLPAVFDVLRPGHRVAFDDGHAHAVVEVADAAGVLLRLDQVPGGELRLAGDKGINLPDCELDVPLLGEDDERALAFASRHADLIGASFVRGPEDVEVLHQRLASLGANHLGVLLKIETRSGFARLPAILLAAMQRHPTGVMIARGDLAIETSFERLAELQEEILWLSEAAHLPAVLATQVLDGLARTGQPSRAEVTDAAMGVRAECVMLNKGPYVAEAVRVLDDILRRMEQHQYKKRSLYRRLHLELPPARVTPA